MEKISDLWHLPQSNYLYMTLTTSKHRQHCITASYFQDDKITQDEWCKMWGECMAGTNDYKHLPEWQQSYMDFMFEVNDTSGKQA